MSYSIDRRVIGNVLKRRAPRAGTVPAGLGKILLSDSGLDECFSKTLFSTGTGVYRLAVIDVLTRSNTVFDPWWQRIS